MKAETNPEYSIVTVGRARCHCMHINHFVSSSIIILLFFIFFSFKVQIVSVPFLFFSLLTFSCTLQEVYHVHGFDIKCSINFLFYFYWIHDIEYSDAIIQHAKRLLLFPSIPFRLSTPFPTLIHSPTFIHEYINLPWKVLVQTTTTTKK